MTSTPAGSVPAFPAPRHYGWLALGFLAFAVYGSLVPLDYRPVAIVEAIDRYRAAWLVPVRVESRSDWLSNILLFVPLGFLLTGWLAVDRPRKAVALTAVAVPIALASLSAAIELAQVYFPSRTVSSRDVVAESIGGAIGVATWLVAGPWMTGLARARSTSEGSRAAWLLPAYLAALMLTHALPLDLTISPYDLYHKYTAGMVHLVPFSDGVLASPEVVRRSADEFASFLVAGLLLGPATGWRARSLPVVMGQGLMMAGCVELSQLFVASRRFDATDVIIGGVAILGGWVAARAIRPPPLGAGDRSRWAVFACWFLLAAISSWSPFDFDGDVGTLLDRASAVKALPFVDYYQDSVWNAAEQIFRKAALFFPLGMIFGRGFWRPALSAIGLATLFEAGQLALPGREPSITDLLIEVAGACAGALALGTNPAHSPGPAWPRLPGLARAQR